MQQPGSHRRFRSESMEPGGRNGPSVEDILPLKKPALSPAAPDSGGQVAGGVSEPVGAGLSNETAAVRPKPPCPQPGLQPLASDLALFPFSKPLSSSPAPVRLDN